ncbi:transposase, IS911 [Legionella taurinensis]|nr:transposase, IS911 [Legionella taurinensis]STY25110.1 transposase, IS911 [Legionella taurinensis]STY25352.1 transposase, IS911 [Legionella taurinensis]STY25728.1 transposase, IS911 [Legionella taurinensis]STY25909.1 transposase, IS911 [Legionella taurinensis]
MSTRRKYTKEFKLDAVSLVTEQGYACLDAARSLGINSNILSRWIREAAENNENAFRGNGKLTEEQLEIRQLREEVRRLTMEKEILKKATVFFAKEAK